MSHWIYSAVALAMVSGAFGMAVCALILRRVVVDSERPRPAVAWLLVVLMALSLGQILEQSRVLAFRLSFDGHVDPGVFRDIYDATWNVVGSKILLSAAVMLGAAVKLGLYCDRDDETITRWAVWAGISTMIAWVVLANIIGGILL